MDSWDFPLGTSHDHLRWLTTKEGKRSYIDRIQAELRQGVMPEIVELFRRLKNLRAAGCSGELGWEIVSKHSESIRRTLRRNFNYDVVTRCEMLLDEFEEFRVFEHLVLADDRSTAIFEAVVRDASNSNATDRAHVFVDKTHLNRDEHLALEKQAVVSVRLSRIAKIPLGMFVSAASFESWYGRPPGVLKGGKPSLEVILKYASMGPEPPPIESVTGYVLPDGRVYFRSHEAHRLAAAIRRGDTHLELRAYACLYVLDYCPELL